MVNRRKEGKIRGKGTRFGQSGGTNGLKERKRKSDVDESTLQNLKKSREAE